MRLERAWWSVALLLVAGGCVEEVDPSLRVGAERERAEVEAAVPQEPAPGLNVTVRDCQVTLATQSANAGPVTFHVRNEGSTPQALVLQGPQGEAASGEIPAGATAMMSVSLAAGTYQLQCATPPADATGALAATLNVH